MFSIWQASTWQTGVGSRCTESCSWYLMLLLRGGKGCRSEARLHTARTSTSTNSALIVTYVTSFSKQEELWPVQKQGVGGQVDIVAGTTGRAAPTLPPSPGNCCHVRHIPSLAG